MSVQAIESEAQFEQVLSLTDRVVIHFYEEWESNFETLAVAFETAAKSFKNVRFFKVRPENFPKYALQLNVKEVPTFVIFSDGSESDRVNGANVAELTVKLHKQASCSASGKFNFTYPYTSEAQGDAFYKELVNKAPVLLFMKGDPREPRCGFSRQIVAILESTGTPYATFDILKDENVRQGLKAFAEWPTYPQLWVKGELIGGLDIIREMQENGELVAALKT